MFKALKMRLYNEAAIDSENRIFTDKQLLYLLLPIIMEQLLNSFMGMADTMMVSNVGSSAISAVSLVDAINMLVIQVFSAMATGATIICSQYLGAQNKEKGNEAARQVFITMLVISVGVMLAGLIGRRPLLTMVFGDVEEQVMTNCMTYFHITILSYPFLALFNAGAAFYRAGGNSKFPMKVSIFSNIVNVIGNAVLIFGFNMGVAGAALATLLSRVISMVIIFYFLHKPRQPIVLNHYMKIRPDLPMITRVLAIGIPAGIENGMFQFGKLAIQSTVSEMGTVAIAAQAMTNMLENVNGIFAVGVGIGLMTVVGQSLGAGRKEEAKYYIVKLTVYAEIGLLISCLLTMLIAKPVTILGGMDQESAQLCIQMMVAITIWKPLLWVLSFVPAYGMRAAGDVKFSMMISTLSMWLCRVLLCVYLCKVWGFGPMAVWIGMFVDWAARSVIFTVRFMSGKWLEKQVI